MEPNGVATMNTAAAFRHSRTPSSDRFLEIFSSSPPSSTTADGDELNEDDILWTGDFTTASADATAAASDEATTNHHNHRSLFPENSGILAALAESNHRHHPVLHRKPSIPKPPLQQDLRERDRDFNDLLRTHSLSQSVPSSRKFLHHSAPMNVPVLSTAMAKQRKNKLGEISDDNGDDDVVLPPHELVARGSGVSPKTTFSVLEGVGRTLKGRDLRQVRNAVWRKTGFLD